MEGDEGARNFVVVNNDTKEEQFSHDKNSRLHQFFHDKDNVLPHNLFQSDELGFSETLPDNYRNQAMMNNTTNNLHVDNNLYNLPLESAFSGLNISSDRHQLPYEDDRARWGSFVDNGGVGPSSNIGINGMSSSLSHHPMIPPQLSYYDLRRIRAQCAARNHMGMFSNSGLVNPFYESNYYGGSMNNYQNPRSTFVPSYSRANWFHSNHGFANPNILTNRSNRGNNDHNRYRASEIGSSSSSSSSWHNSYSARNRFNSMPLDDLNGNIRVVVKDRDGCRFLQQKIEDGNPGDFHMIYSELKDHVCELMTNPFATNLFELFLGACDEEKLDHLILVVVVDDLRLEEICLDGQGTKAMHKLISHATSSNQKHFLVSALARIAVTLMKSTNGQHVIQHCFLCFSSEDVEPILDSVSDHCFEIAIDKSGCCVLQTCIIPAMIGSNKEHIISELISNSRILSENPYGNYVVQFILSFKVQHLTSDVLRELSGSYVSLSMNKYGSNVVEKCLQFSLYGQKICIVEEIIKSPMFLDFLQSPYGNYVAQKIMIFAKGNILNMFINQILVRSESLHNHPHGKSVLEKAMRLMHLA